jgi:alcohol dehydrogenase
LKLDGAPLNHHMGCSVFAEYATLSRRSLVKIDADIPLDEAALFGCAVLTGVGAVINTAQVRAGASVAVIGLGGVGLAALIGAQAAGARQIVAVDLSDAKLEQAKALGATHTVNAGSSDAKDQVRALSNGGVEFAFEFAGAIRALELAYAITRRGGTTVTAGLPPSTASLGINAVSLVAEERTLKGSYIGTCVPSRDIPRFIALYRQGRLPVDKLLSGRLRLDQINHGFDLLHEGKALRQVVVFS